MICLPPLKFRYRSISESGIKKEWKGKHWLSFLYHTEVKCGCWITRILCFRKFLSQNGRLRKVCWAEYNGHIRWNPSLDSVFSHVTFIFSDSVSNLNFKCPSFNFMSTSCIYMQLQLIFAIFLFYTTASFGHPDIISWISSWVEGIHCSPILFCHFMCF